MTGVELSHADEYLDRARVMRAACGTHSELDWFGRSARVSNACRAVRAARAVRSGCLAFATADREIGISAGGERRQRRRLNRDVA
jgi:hypothetical protein